MNNHNKHSMVNHCISQTDNPDLTEERQNCHFDTHALADVLYGGHDNAEIRRKIDRFIDLTPELKNISTDLSFKSKLEGMEQTFRNHVISRKYLDQIVPQGNKFAYEYYKRCTVGSNSGPGYLTDVIVIPLLETCCTEEQRRLFLTPALRYEHYGAYAQTELGHGTNTGALQTTATFDKTTQTFVLNTPELSAYKWWPGNLGKVASWCVVMANLLTNGRNYGMHPFYVQIRDSESHQPLLGVKVGEIGTAFGLSANDNGYLAFDNFRVPKVALLAKHFYVTDQGEYVQACHPKIAYVGMMYVRCAMIHEIMGEALAGAACIAVRYSCVRRQGMIEKSQQEVKIIDYRTQQYRVFPQLCRAICFTFAGQKTIQLYHQMRIEISNGVTTLMEPLHAITSGLKAVCSYQASIGIEQCRMSCGGHGYSHASGLPSLYQSTVGGCTYEGDNIVMLLQLARYLMKRAGEVVVNKRPKNLSSMDRHLFESDRYCWYNKKNEREQRVREALKCFEHLSRELTLNAYKKLAEECKICSKETAWNNVSVSLVKAARAFTRVYLAEAFVSTVQGVSDKEVKVALDDCLDVYLHYEILECRADLLETNYVNPIILEDVSTVLLSSLQRLRSNAVNIVDSFEFHDRVLNSQIGAKNGHAYQNLFDWAQKSPLNQTEVLPFHQETLRELMRQQRHDRLGSKL
ncbi:unnamed protein product [Bursaphelenchus okinawaensis]|uniref:Acyl-coenzyme A oxidase n=1 Tax=Bursaphelenchus okinawaensis TaxID=465554 RepID=A0A811KZG9_9BILA|nr:unnamed protein product [Bursaphelenchus okinawaensis]CAG9114198.1 unnamed protein product [Bursaphelenchus okinawaensis]